MTPVRPGEILAEKYRIDRILGVGGMGAVVAATHLQLDQKVALKFMLPAGMANSALVGRFAREARAAARLKSDHVARVLDVGTLPGGAPFMVMEYLDGCDLASVLEKDGPMHVPSAVDCVLQACDAVAEAHTLGIVHRDLKPQNLFLTQRNDGHALIKVLDFGISKLKSDEDLGLTKTSEVIGSPYYMSPEQLKSSRGADERSDIWALGVILYELLTAKVPWAAESVTALTVMILQETPVDVARVRAEVPPGLADVVRRCLEKDPRARFSSIAELAAALAPFAPPDSQELVQRIARIGAGPTPFPRAPMSLRVPVAGSTSVNGVEQTMLSPTRSRRGATLAIVAVVLGAAAVGVVVSQRQPANPPSAATATGFSVTAPGTGAQPLAPPAPSATADTSPSATAAATASSAVSAAAPATSGAPRGGARPAPRAGDQPGDPPRYRTPW